jgi:hypothetical protein
MRDTRAARALATRPAVGVVLPVPTAATTPHLHFQILTTPTYFPADSKPFALDSFTLLGRITGRDVVQLAP